MHIPMSPAPYNAAAAAATSTTIVKIPLLRLWQHSTAMLGSAAGVNDPSSLLLLLLLEYVVVAATCCRSAPLLLVCDALTHDSPC